MFFKFLASERASEREREREREREKERERERLSFHLKRIDLLRKQEISINEIWYIRNKLGSHLV